MRAYAYLMEEWEPGDQVFIFGFSRGAYTARVLAGLLHAFGLMPRGAHNLLPYVIKYYRAFSERSNKDEMPELESIYNEFRRTFARTVNGSGDTERHFPVHFLGVWDTVSTVGWIWDPKSFRYTAFNPSVTFAPARPLRSTSGGYFFARTGCYREYQKRAELHQEKRMEFRGW